MSNSLIIAGYDHVIVANYCLSSSGEYNGAYYRDWKVAKKGSSVERLDLNSRGLHFRGISQF